MRTTTPKVIILAGPNGAGKSTLAPRLIRDAVGIDQFVNADVIARGLSAFDPDSAAIEAGRVFRQRLDENQRQRTSFAFETTLSSRSLKPRLESLRAAGYEIHLHYVWLRTPDMAVNRVRDRVRQGGHNVPEETVCRRYERGIRNFFGLFRPLADSWGVYDNSGPEGPVTIAIGSGEHEIAVVRPKLWAQFRLAGGL
jgi:predicted ABC-type ATPase